MRDIVLSLSDCVACCKAVARLYGKKHKGRGRREKQCLEKGYLVERLEDGRLHLLALTNEGLFVVR